MLVRRWLAVAVTALLTSLGTVALAAEPRADLFTVSDVAVDATAANASAARDQAIADGEQRAFAILLGRLTLAADRPRLPKVSDAKLPELVQGFEVAHERSSGVRYLADYTFHFRPDAVRQVLRQAGIPVAETAGKPLVVLAVLRQGDHATLWEDPNPWRDAWASAKLDATSLRLVQPLGELEDVAAIDAASATAGDPAKLAAVSQRYRDADVLVSQAMLKTDGAHRVDVTSTRYSPGTPGSEQTWTSSAVAAQGDSDGDIMGRAIADTVAQVAEAAKAANMLDYSQSGTLLARVPASSLQEWIAVRDRLAGVPAIRGSRLVSLDRGGAQVELSYVGDPAQLRTALAQRDLELSGNEPDWVLQRRAAAAPR